MPPIHRLSQSIINKIAAGEVIERPASVVKELVENSVDAGASRIDITVHGGGRDLIRVVDTGHGIEPEQLPLALASHATSKITEADDLFSVRTLGFRGEALASVAEISRMLVRSRTPDRPGGAEVEVVGGELSEVRPCGCPVGTSIEVSNLFFNTPVRRKFLKTTQTEAGHIAEAVSRIAMPNPKIHFTLRHESRVVLDLPASDLRERIARIVGRGTAERLIAIASSHEQVRLAGYVGHPSESRGNTKLQYLFLNGRAIRDRSLQHALAEAYRGLLTAGRQPIAFLFLEMPAELCDVNVHPTKLEVRFQDSGRLYSQLLSTVRTKFLTTDLSTHVGAGGEEDDPTEAHDREAAVQFRQQVIDWAHGETPPRHGSVAPPGGCGSGRADDFAACETAGTRAATSAPLRGRGASGGLRLHSIDRGDFRPFPQASLSRAARCPAGREVDVTEEEAATDAPPSVDTQSSTPPAVAIQIHNRYVVTEEAEGLVIIDQHALHERILFERLKRRLATGRGDIQNLLVPEPVDLSPAERALILEWQELLGELGLRIEPFGGDTVVVTGYPTLLAHVRPAEIVRSVLERLGRSGKMPDRTELMNGLLETMACKAAIKAGDPLSPSEIDALLAARGEIDDAHHCPHGRPSTLVFSCEELDKQFRRT